MGETANIAQMATKISDEIFNVFGWSREPLENTEFPCEKPDDHELKTHPADAVFWYDDPYAEGRAYINTDLKSYARGSIKPHQIRKALRSLGLAVDCANNSKEYSDKFIHTESQFKVLGLLFLYNHDGDFDSNFSDRISSIKPASLKIPKGRIVHLLGPDRIAALASVAADILLQRGQNKIPSADQCYFHYPDMVLSRAKRNLASAASIETLLGPWIPFAFSASREGRSVVDHIFYYLGEGSSAEEFKYLLDYFFRSQTLGDYNRITIKTTNADKKAPTFLQKAKELYANDFFGLDEFRRRLDRVGLESVTRTVTGYNDLEIGMRGSE